jgi:tetratricopeptide (TPR) repeat protein
MEVAMLARTGHVALRSLFSLSLILPLAALTGCSEVVNITYANKSREKGMGLYKDQSYVDAAGAFANAVRQDPRDFESHFYLGVCNDEMGQHQQAFQQYRTSLDVMARYIAGQYDPKFREMVLDTLAASVARNDVGDVELGRLEERARTGRNAEDWFVVAKVYRLKGDPDLAIYAYRRAAQWAPASFAVRKEFGLWLLDPLNQPREAEQHLRHAYKLNANDASMKCAPRLWRVRSQFNRSQISTSSGKANPGGITPSIRYCADLTFRGLPTTSAAAW